MDAYPGPLTSLPRLAVIGCSGGLFWLVEDLRCGGTPLDGISSARGYAALDESTRFYYDAHHLRCCCGLAREADLIGYDVEPPASRS